MRHSKHDGCAQAVIRTGAKFGSSTCDDGALSASPTCGWATDASGSRVYASQGFCCSCTSSALAAATLGSGTTQRARPPAALSLVAPCVPCLPDATLK